MKVVIEKLNAEILENQFGFHYDGSYWIKHLSPIKLSSTGEGKYLVSLEGATIGDMTPDPVEDNTDLIKLIIGLLPSYMQARGRSEQLTQLNPEILTNWINEYLDIPDERIKLAIKFGPQGAAISPGNEFTFTLLNGVTCRFKVFWTGIDDMTYIDEVYYHPITISYSFLKSLLGDNVKSIDKVLVQINEVGDWDPFFGAGMI
jgi:hypothetical protein